MQKDDLLLLLWKHLESKLKYDIVMTGCVKYLFLKHPPMISSVFVKENKGLISLSVPVEVMLEKVENLQYTPVPQPGRNELESTLGCIEAMEETVLMSGRSVLQCFFVSEVWKKAYDVYLGMSDSLPEESNKADAKIGESKSDEVDPKSDEADPNLGESDEDDPKLGESDRQITAKPIVEVKPTDVEEDYYKEALANFHSEHKELLEEVEFIGDRYRAAAKKAFERHPCNRWKAKLQLEISQHHFLAQQLASFSFRQDKNKELEGEVYAFYPWQTVRNRHERSMIKSKEEAREVGRKGEEHALEHLKGRYPAPKYDVDWVNGPDESNESDLSYDIAVRDTINGTISFFEVKSSSISEREWFYLSPIQYQLAQALRKQFTVLFVHVNLKDNTFNVKEYNDPAHNLDLHLAMMDVSKFRSNS